MVRGYMSYRRNEPLKAKDLLLELKGRKKLGHTLRYIKSTIRPENNQEELILLTIQNVKREEMNAFVFRDNYETNKLFNWLKENAIRIRRKK